jgi:aryl-alcohol dehydrogenase-like predicted oxidoreductase
VVQKRIILERYGRGEMKQIKIGSTALTSSVLGLGSGRESKYLGLQTGGERLALRLVRSAFDLGITHFDTAPQYGTEQVIAKGLGRNRNSVIVGTKTIMGLGVRQGWKMVKKRVTARLEESLKAFGYIDIYYMHWISPGVLDGGLEALQETLSSYKNLGDIRYLGVSETFPRDLNHKMLGSALYKDFFDVFMIAFNRSCSYGLTHIKIAEKKKKGVVIMQANSGVDRNEFAYRWVSDASPNSVILTGTSSVEHLVKNIGVLS